MFRFAPFVLILQGFCIYHAYSNKSEQKWYWVIMIFPILGSLFYLYHHFYNRQNASNISIGVKRVINTNYDVEKLERETKFSDTIANKLRLADKYVELERYDEAIDLYKSCLSGYNADDPITITKLVQVYYLNQDYQSSIDYGNRLSANKDFLKSEARIGYAWSIFHLNQWELSEKVFHEMDRSYTNYNQRMEFSKFLNQTGRKEEALQKLEELTEEFQDMTSQERRFYKYTKRAISRLYQEMSKNS